MNKWVLLAYRTMLRMLGFPKMGRRLRGHNKSVAVFKICAVCTYAYSTEKVFS